MCLLWAVSSAQAGEAGTSARWYGNSLLAKQSLWVCYEVVQGKILLMHFALFSSCNVLRKKTQHSWNSRPRCSLSLEILQAFPSELRDWTQRATWDLYYQKKSNQHQRWLLPNWNIPCRLTPVIDPSSLQQEMELLWDLKLVLALTTGLSANSSRTASGINHKNKYLFMQWVVCLHIPRWMQNVHIYTILPTCSAMKDLISQVSLRADGEEEIFSWLGYSSDLGHRSC